jgi:uncharacterized protein YceH (UPF0502 family)
MWCIQIQRMMAMVLALVVSVTAAAEETCPGDRSCGEEIISGSSASRGGSVLLQISRQEEGKETQEEKEQEVEQQKAKGAPMSGRLDTLEKEIASLTDRMSALEGDVGVSGGAEVGGDAGVALMAKKQRRDDEDSDESDGASLLAYAGENAADTANKKSGSIKDRITTAEGQVAALKSKLQVLQNQVMGGASLIQTAGSSGEGRDSNLIERLEGLEAEVSKLRTGVSNLEHEVSG